MTTATETRTELAEAVAHAFERAMNNIPSIVIRRADGTYDVNASAYGTGGEDTEIIRIESTDDVIGLGFGDNLDAATDPANHLELNEATGYLDSLLD